MGAPSKTQLESWTDHVAARLQADLSGLLGEGLGAAGATLWAGVDGSGDPAVETALGAAALAVDEAALPSAQAAMLNVLLARSPFRDFAAALRNLVVSDEGGAYASWRAYLADKAANVHPLYAELHRSIYGAGDFTSAGTVAGVFAPAYSSRAPDRVYVGANGALSEETVDAEDAGTADITLFGTNGHHLYIGSRWKFNQLAVGLSTLANVTITPTISYWNGNEWVQVSGLTDSSTGFTKNDRITFTLPADWQRTNQDSGPNDFADLSPLYYLKITRGQATLNTPPVGTSIRIIPAAPVLQGTAHLGVDQPPLAIVRVTGVNTVSVESVVDPDTSRFVAPAIAARALTPIAQDLTLTVAYTDQDGNDATKAQTAWTAPAALGTKTLALDTGDTGVGSIRTSGWSAVTDATEGVFEIYSPALRTPAL